MQNIKLTEKGQCAVNAIKLKYFPEQIIVEDVEKTRVYFCVFNLTNSAQRKQVNYQVYKANLNPKYSLIEYKTKRRSPTVLEYAIYAHVDQNVK